MHNESGRSARDQARRLRARHRDHSLGHTAAWAAGGLLIGTALHPALALPGLAAGAAIGWVIPTARTGQHTAAGRWEAGAAGEEATALLLDPLARRGWSVLHDRAIPGSRANLDHLLIGPQGQVVVVDSKWCSAKHGATVHLRDARLHSGQRDCSGQVATLLWEAGRVSAVLGVGTAAVMVVHGAPVSGHILQVGQVVVCAPDRLVSTVLAVQPDRSALGPSARQTAAAAFPPYGQ